MNLQDLQDAINNTNVHHENFGLRVLDICEKIVEHLKDHERSIAMLDSEKADKTGLSSEDAICQL